MDYYALSINELFSDLSKGKITTSSIKSKILKMFSNELLETSIIMIDILIVIIMALSFVQYQRSDNVIDQQNTTFENRNNDYLISSDSVVYDIHNNVKSATNDTLNNTRKIKSKANDSLQMKKTMNANTKNLPRKRQRMILSKKKKL